MSASSLPSTHEAFEIEQKRREHVVRQPRHEVAGVECRLRIDGREYPVVDYSAYGISVTLPPTESMPPTGTSGDLLLEGRKLAVLEVAQARRAERTDGSTVAFEITGPPLDVVRVQAATAAASAVRTMRIRNEQNQAVPEEFRRMVLEMRDFLEHMKKTIDGQPVPDTLTHDADVEAHQRAYVETVTEYMHQMCDHEYPRMAQYLSNLDEETGQRCMAYFGQHVHHLIREGAMANRSLAQPLGYAGDYEMMRHIYKQDLLGDTMFAKCMHAYTVSHANAQAVRNRVEYLGGKIKEQIAEAASRGERIRILSVACGPAFEVQRLIESGVDLSNVEIHLLDQDLGALQTAQREIQGAARRMESKVTLKFLNQAIRNIIKEGLKEKYDLIYSAGLFDYFSDPIAQIAAKRFLGGLTQGGQAVIGNFTHAPTNIIAMDYLLDWKLIYRDELALQRLYKPVTSHIEIESEPNTINLFAVLRP